MALDCQQGCQMVYVHIFQAKYTNLCIISRALEWIMLAYFVVIWNILLPFGIFFWLMYQEKSGTPFSVKNKLIAV
jgi:hypothetical protein